MPSLADRQVADRDDELPGLGLLLDVQAFCEALRQSDFQFEPENRWEIRYIRYKPRRRCIVVYEDHHRNTIVATARTIAGWKKHEALSRSGFHRSIDRDSEFGHTFWKSACVSVDPFPRDRQLPAVAKLLDPVKGRKVLRRVLGEVQSSAEWKMKTLAYKPARRFVACGMVGDVPQCTLKFYTSSGYRSALRRVEALERVNWPMAKVIGKSDRYDCIATEWIAGENLTETARSSHDCVQLFGQVGRSLGALHALGLQKAQVELPAEDLPNYPELARDLGHLSPSLLDRACQLASELQNNLLTVNVKPTIIHGDCYAKQVVVEGERVRWIDWDQVSIGDASRDLGNFVAQLHWDSERGEWNPELIDSLEKAFLDGYVSIAGPVDWRRYGFQLSGALLACTGHPFRRAIPNWPAAMARMLGKAERAMENALATEESIHPLSRRSQSGRSVHGSRKGSEGTTIDTSPTIDTMLDCQFAEEQLKTDCPDIAKRIGDYHVESARVTRHKPGRRCMIEYQLQSRTNKVPGSSHRSKELALLGKVRFRGLKTRHGETQQRLSDAFHRRGGEVSIPPVLGFCHRWSMWLQERVDGIPVTADHLTPMDSHRRVASALAELHQCEVPEITEVHGVEDELRILRDRVSETCWRHPKWASSFDRMMVQSQELSMGLRSFKHRLVHRDFYFDQVMIGDERLYLLDLDLACRGPAAMDVGNYAAHLIEYGVRFPELNDRCFEAARAFCDAYRSMAPEVDADEIRRWMILSLARLVVLSVDFPGRAHTTHDLLVQVLES